MNLLKRTATAWPHQNSLPSLPVPNLEETCQTYLESCKPLLSSVEFERTKNSVSEFLQNQGNIQSTLLYPGPVLHKRLVEHAKEQNSQGKSWLIEWWNDYAYMSYRDPVVVWVSYFFVFRDVNLSKSNRAASFILSALKFKQLIDTTQLKPDMAKTPLCMNQYQFMFSTRIPAIPSDTTRLSRGDHIIVMRKNSFYKIDINGASFASLSNQINWIYENAQESPAIGSLTTENRDQWTKIRQDLLKNKKNKIALDSIEDALFVLCLDESTPVTTEQISRACWHGDGKNRFFDKSLQFIIFDNGKAGFCGEHSMMDATPTSRLCEYVCEQTELTKPVMDPTAQFNIPTQIVFDVSSKTNDQIQVSQSQFKALVDKHDVKVVEYFGYGKEQIKGFKISPDAYAQLAIQLAYFKKYHALTATYESAQTKAFQWGRTEVCRSVTSESFEWVKSMTDPKLTDVQRGVLGRKAANSQVAYMAKAVKGKGCDRHFLGLRRLIKPTEPIPSLFCDPAFSKTSYWKLSTSQVTSEYYTGYGWGEVVPEGYGIAYMVKNNSMHFNITSLHLQNDEMKHYFSEALEEMKNVFQVTIPVEAKL